MVLSNHSTRRGVPAAATRSLLRIAQRRDLHTFVRGAFGVLHGSSRPFIANWHIEAICHYLTMTMLGIVRNLLITMPPRHLKTICCSVALPAFLLGQDPTAKIMIITYGNSLGTNIRDQLKQLVRSQFYREVFPGTKIKSTDMWLRTSAGGYIMITSVEGSVTGLGADYIIVDDIMKSSEAVNSQVERQKARDFIPSSLLSRFDDKTKGRMIVVQQRQHEDDVAAYLIGTGFYTHLNLPAIAEEAQDIPLSANRVHKRQKGDVLFPQKEPLEELERLRKEMGAYHFGCQYQQNPIPLGGHRMDWSRWTTYWEHPDLYDFQWIVQSWDTAFSAEQTSDFSACTTWGYCNGIWYLLDVFRDRLDYEDLKARVRLMQRRWQADTVIVENAATGRPLLQYFRREGPIGAKFIAYEPRDEKRVRFETQIVRLYEGHFALPEMAPWLAEFRNECQSFPTGRHDDMVDSMVQFLDVLGGRHGRSRLRGNERPQGRPRPKGHSFKSRRCEA